jgi:hypothetical protein
MTDTGHSRFWCKVKALRPDQLFWGKIVVADRRGGKRVWRQA